MGGSLGGLTAALVLRDIGCDVKVLERSPVSLEGRGAGIVIHPTTIRYLVERAGTSAHGIGIGVRTLRYLDSNGFVAHEQPLELRFASYYSLYRDLLACFGEEHYRLGSEVVGFHQTAESVVVEEVDGTTHSCDLLVCADGIRSTARRLLLPEVTIDYAGYIAWRGTTRPGDLPVQSAERIAGAITYAVLDRSHMLTYPIPPSDDDPSAEPVANWLWYRNVAPGRDLQELFTDKEGAVRDLTVPPGSVQDKFVDMLRADAVSLLPPPLADAVLHSSDPFIQAVVDVAIPRMVFGRICIMGDAAFAARPHVAVGTAKAADDAWQLANAIKTCDAVDVDERLRSWEARQMKLGRSVMVRTRRAGERSQFEGSWEVGEQLPFGLYEIGDSALPVP